MGAIPTTEWPPSEAAVAARRSACLRLTGLSVVLKIRVSVVRFGPWLPPQFSAQVGRGRLFGV
jgi:hypothetical protein